MLNTIVQNAKEKINFKEVEWQYIFDFYTAEYTIFLQHKNSIYKKTFSQEEIMNMPNTEKFKKYTPFTWYRVTDTILR